jgi:putative transcriptional regulator
MHERWLLGMHNRIALFRAEQGVSRRALAEAVGVNNQTIGYLERGDYKPSLELALKIARYFKAPVEMLFSLERFEPIAMTLRRAGEEEPGHADPAKERADAHG